MCAWVTVVGSFSKRDKWERGDRVGESLGLYDALHVKVEE